MYENNNKIIINEIAGEQYKNHKLRNWISILAIALTAMLITAMLTAGLSFISTSSNSMEQTPGPEAHGSIAGDRSQYEKVLAQQEVKWANYVERCSTAALHNREFGGIETRLFAPDANFYKDNHVNLIEGDYPSTPEEILISDSMATNLQLDSPVGTQFPLEVVIKRDGVDTEEEIKMTICGVYKNPLYGISSIYEEIYTGIGFAKEYNSELKDEDNIIYVYLNNLNPFLLKTDITGNIFDLCDKVEGTMASSGKYNMATMQDALKIAIPVFFFVFMLMGSGYFLIYNIFHISISSDIRWYGMMKTIGTTKNQLKRILIMQIRKMSVLGIAIGTIAGYLVGTVIAPNIIGLTNWSVYYKAPPFVPIALLAVLFTYMTIRISARKPLKTASSISPIEAVRYNPKKKKNIFTVISLGLSGSIFLIVMNVVMGFQEELYVNRYNQNDFQIRHKSTLWVSDEPYKSISESLIEHIKELPFVEKADVIYKARTNDEDGIYGIYPSSAGEIRPEGKLYQYYEKNFGEHNSINSRGNLSIAISGLSGDRWNTEMVNYNLVSGEIDNEKFASGNYIVFQKDAYNYIRNAYGIKSDILEGEEIQAGDKLELSFYDKERDTYIEKELTVLAVIENAHEYTSSDIYDSAIIIPDTLFKEIYNGYSKMIGSIQISAEEELTKDEINHIMNLVREEDTTQLMITSRYESGFDAENNKKTYSLIGIFLVSILGVVGISNVANTVAADIFAHRIEYAAMQSIGMTKKQLFRVLLMESGKFCIMALILIIPVGSVGAYMLASSSLFTGFNAGLFIQALLAVVMVMFTICAVMAHILVRVLNQKSIVERLREIE